MPIYEYRCKKCGAVSEFLTGIGKEDIVSCKKCGSLRVEKLISAPVLLGDGMKQNPGQTCCGSAERCEMPPCNPGRSACRRD